MEIVLILGLLAAASALLVLAWRRQWSPAARRSARRDDTRRVGDDPSISPEMAARRAGDRNSWMIPSGF